MRSSFEIKVNSVCKEIKTVSYQSSVPYCNKENLSSFDSNKRSPIKMLSLPYEMSVLGITQVKPKGKLTV